jgi:hypothetical protein
MAGHALPSALKIHPETDAFTRPDSAAKRPKNRCSRREKRPQGDSRALLSRKGRALIRRKSMKVLDVLCSGR